MTKKRLDDWLSDAQRVLRDGHNDALSRAVAEARNLLNDPETVRLRRENAVLKTLVQDLIADARNVLQSLR